MCKEVAIEDLKKNYPKEEEEVELSNRRDMYILRWVCIFKGVLFYLF